QKRSAAFLQRVLHDGSDQQLLRDLAIADLVRMRGGKIGGAPLDQHGLQIQRSHLRAGTTARVDRFRTGHDSGGQDEIFARRCDRGQTVVLAFDRIEVARDLLANVDVVEAYERRGVYKSRLASLEVQQRPLLRAA